MIHYENDEIFDKNALYKLSYFFDKNFLDFDYHGKGDDFDFTSKDRPKALECTLGISNNLKKVDIYEKMRERGMNPKKDIEGSLIDSKGVLLAYLGSGMEEIKKVIACAIKKKAIKVERRKIIEPNIKVDLCISIPEVHLFNRERELDFVEDLWLINQFLFERIFILFSSALYVFGSNKRFILFENRI